MTTSTSGLLHTVNGTGLLIPGLVLPYEEPEWDDADVLMPTFGTKGLTILYGERKARMLVFPIDVFEVTGGDPPEPVWTNQAAREDKFSTIGKRQGKVGRLTVVDQTGTTKRTYPTAYFRGLRVIRRRHDEWHGHNAFCQAIFLEIAAS
jgi:hypothetical protein